MSPVRSLDLTGLRPDEVQQILRDAVAELEVEDIAETLREALDPADRAELSALLDA